jgi:hypothetical protein
MTLDAAAARAKVSKGGCFTAFPPKTTSCAAWSHVSPQLLNRDLMRNWPRSLLATGDTLERCSV